MKPIASSSSASFKVEAKKGEWLPGLASPGYLDGRYSSTLMKTFIYIPSPFSNATLKIILQPVDTYVCD